MKYFTYIFAVILVGMAGCDYLAFNEEDFIDNPEEQFVDFGRTTAMLSHLYSGLPSGFNEIGGSMRASATDDAMEVAPAAYVENFYDGSWSPIEAIDNQWGGTYDDIRDANLFIQHIDTTLLDDRKYNDDYDTNFDKLQYYQPEARFIRAFYYFELLKRYGQVPLVTETLTDVERANTIEVASSEEIVDFIVSELDSVITRLPVSYQNVHNQEFGRATRGAAMALKARTLLYWASPLLNPNDEISRWEDAAEASAAIIDSSWYSLEGDYADITNNIDSDELILGRRTDATNSFEKANFPPSYQGIPGTAPSQNLVDTYEMANGQDIDETGAGYDPQDPYANRDPRLAKTVITHNSNWKGTAVDISRDGKDGPPQEFATTTGYYLKKYVIESLSIQNNQTTQTHLWVFFRYGEVLLNYAEAMNQAYGPNNNPEGFANGWTAYDAVNFLRDRGSGQMPSFTPVMLQSEFQEELREERRVELAFENHRFWDIRRWKIGEVTETIEGMEITGDSGNYTYNTTIVENRTWEDKYYLYPYPQSEVFINENLQNNQNPGW